MNVRLQYNTNLTAGIHYEGQLLMNNYTIKVLMITNTTDTNCHNIAYERLKFFLYKCLEGSVFIDQRDTEACRLYIAAGIRLTTLPETPIDQILGIMLYSKLDAIMEDHIQVVEVEISSELGDRMIYFHNETENLGPFEEDGWWNNSNSNHYDINLLFGDNAIKHRTTQWKDVGLEWPEDNVEDTQDLSNTIIFTDFKNNETK